MAGLERQPRESFSLKTDDISGAKPFLKSYQYTNKTDYSNNTTGIEKASPQSRNLQTARIVNPLTPEYKLPSFSTRSYTPPKFLRDSLDISDIKGSAPSSSQRNLLRNTLDVADISNAKKREFREDQGSAHVNLNISNRMNGKFETKRVTDPLNPQYFYRKDNVMVKYGEIKGNSPKNLVDLKKSPHNRSLDVSDIQGTSCTSSFVMADESSFKKPKFSLKEYSNSRLSGESTKRNISSLNNSGIQSPVDRNIKKSLNNSTLISSKSSKGLDVKTLRSSMEQKNSIKTISTPTKYCKKPLPRSPIYSPKAKK